MTPTSGARVDMRLYAMTALLFAATSTAIVLGQGAVFSSRIDTVRVDALVTDGGQPVLGLKATDFEVSDNGVPQKVDFATFEEIPLNVVLAFDMSDSLTGNRLLQLRKAGQTVLDALRVTDKAALVTFNGVVTIASPLTGDLARVKTALGRTGQSGDTSLVDAVHSAMIVSEADQGRALVIVFSDGVDIGSFLRPEAVLATAKRADAVVYAVTDPVYSAGSFLGELCNFTGGRVVAPSATNLDRTFLTIFNEFRQRYLISYTPAGVTKTGWHKLDVKLKDHRGNVKARPGYLVGSGP